MVPTVQLDTWTIPQAKRILKSRYTEAKADKKGEVEQAQRNLETVYTSQPTLSSSPNVEGNDDESASEDGGPIETSMGINLSMKNTRLLHSQLSANPPTCIPRPATSDGEDRRAARAADRVIRHSLRRYTLQEKVDQVTLDTLIKGTGILKVWWNPCLGDILRVGKDGRSLLMSGDMDFRVVDFERFHLDPAARPSCQEPRYAIEEVTMTREDFLVRYPEHRACLRKGSDGRRARMDAEQPSSIMAGSYSGSGDEEEVDTIDVCEYWETGLASTAFAGRFAVFLDDGYLLTPPEPSPHAFRPRPTLEDIRRRQRGVKPIRKPAKARLPYGMLTDIDVTGRVWGKSAIEFAAPLQDLANRVSTTILRNMQYHGVLRILADEGCTFSPGAFENDPSRVIRYSKKNPSVSDPKYMKPAPLPAELTQLHTLAERGVSDAFGTNEAQFGNSSRETSGYQMSYAVNQANLIRRRLFNKYVAFVEWLYTSILDLAIKHWSVARTIQVLGKEKSYELSDLRGADLIGGYSLVCEYGTSLSLDPMTRREEIMRIAPMLKAAGVSDRVILSMMRLGELDSLSDMIGLAEDRGREMVELIVATDAQVTPQFAEDHDAILAYLLFYVMTREFKDLDWTQQGLVREHIRLRFAQSRADKAEMAGQGAGAVPGAPGLPGAAGAMAAGPIGGPAITGPANTAAQRQDVGVEGAAVPPGAVTAGPGASAPSA